METVALKPKEPGQLVSEETIQGIVDAIRQRFAPEKIILFGSYAGGRPNPDSDLDILVIAKSSAPRHRRAVPIRLMFRPTPCAMDVLVFTPQEVQYWNGTLNHIVTEAMTNGKVVYERTP
jgi:DNA polymerase sigma